MAYNLYKSGSFTINDKEGELNQLQGRFNFILNIKSYSPVIQKDIKNNILHSKEKEYQKFLFYIFFYINTKPLLITEGKTDILYIKAALKNMYKNYPGFIIKSDNKFDYKIAFFKRSSKNIEEYLNIKKDGGHELVKIIIYYFNKKYFDFFYNLNKNITPNNPVIILVDNEKAKDKPLETLKKNIPQAYRNDLNFKEKPWFRIGDTNLYILTYRRNPNLKDIEIEDLLEEGFIKELKIQNRVFDKTANKDSELYFSKIH
ncbi:hypothetical protein L8W58_01960 [Campylobacter lari]|nr:hypothetical protein [Campylobacter lari]